jgi:hypothetical protein
MKNSNGLTDFAMFAHAFSNHKERQKYMIYQDNPKKMLWDIYVTFILLLIVNLMPYHIAFK